MKLPSFKRDPGSTLASARAKRADLATKLAYLAAARTAALVESDDDLEAIKAVEDQIAAATRDAGVLDARIAALAVVICERRAEEVEQARLAAIAVVMQRGAKEVELARQVEEDMRRYAASWNKLIGWKARMTQNWDPRLPLPPADAFSDLSALMNEGGMMYYGLGNPTAERRSSLPRAIAPSGVRGLEPLGVVGYVSGAVAGFVAWLKRTPVQVQIPDNESEAA